MDMDGRAYRSVQKIERRFYQVTLVSTLQRTERKHNYNRREVIKVWEQVCGINKNW